MLKDRSVDGLEGAREEARTIQNGELSVAGQNCTVIPVLRGMRQENHSLGNSALYETLSQK